MGEKVKLKFNKNETYGIKVEEIIDMDKSVFIDVYVEAYKILNLLLCEQNISSNIIAFLGERGSGKTSCMETFIKSLENVYDCNILSLENENLKKEMFIYYQKIKLNKKLKKINIIEPTFFSKGVNILELVVSSLFEEFNKKIIEDINKDYEKKKSLLKQFQDVFKSMKYMQCLEAYKNSEIEELIQLGTAINFKEKIKKLVEDYLKFFNGSKLLISIDDIDLNTEYAYEMIEEIRKYLSTSNIVIVMALKLEQLKTIVIKKFLKENDDLIKLENYKESIIDDVENRAEKYLLKLIPPERRLYLKELDEYNYEFEILIGDMKVSTGSKEFQKVVLELVYKKTEIIFLPTNYDINKIIPTNFRELVGFISMLGKMEDLPLTGENKQRIKENNYRILKNYIFDYWINNKLSINSQVKLKNILKSDYTTRNQYIYNELVKVIINKNNSNNGIRFQNSIFIISRILSDVSKVDSKNELFYFAIKLLYSFELYEKNKDDQQDFRNLIGDQYICIEKIKEKSVDIQKIKDLLKSRIRGEKKIGQFLLFFIREEEDQKTNNSSKSPIYKFSLLAPLTNSIYPEKIFFKFGLKEIDDTLLMMFKTINYRNMDIIEEFLKFLENIDMNEERIYESIVLYIEKMLEFNKSLFLPVEKVSKSLNEFNIYLKSISAKKEKINQLIKEKEVANSIKSN